MANSYKGKCDLVYSPGGAFPGKNVPYVLTSQNMLVFEKRERKRYFFSKYWLRLKILYYIQKKGFKYSKGNIFITQYSYDVIKSEIPQVGNVPFTIIPYGSSSRFDFKPKPQKHINLYTKEAPLQLFYPSSIDKYKNQWNIAEAVGILYRKGYNIHLNFIGKIFHEKKKFISSIEKNSACVSYLGLIPYEDVEKHYQNSDIFIFGSTCETMGNVLLEAMSAGLPIISSKSRPMEEVLEDAAVYFNPENIDSIVKHLESFLLSPEIREECAQKGYEYSKKYSWKKFAEEIYSFLYEVA